MIRVLMVCTITVLWNTVLYQVRSRLYFQLCSIYLNIILQRLC